VIEMRKANQLEQKAKEDAVMIEQKNEEHMKV